MANGTAAVQALYKLCRKTFTPSSGAAASPQAIKKLCSLLDAIHPADVGLRDESLEDDRGHGFFGSNLYNNSSRVARWSQPITYLHIYENDFFSIGIFCFPTASVIPLHDHPGMTVLSKILYGSLHVKAYDLVEPSCTAQGGTTDPFLVQLAKLHTDTVLTASCPTTVLYPKGGNIHCFTAVTPCAVLDVLAPPYSEAAGRHCTYYRDYPYSSFSSNALTAHEKEEEYAWLEAVDSPDNFYTRSGTYKGPSVEEEFGFPGSCIIA